MKTLRIALLLLLALLLPLRGAVAAAVLCTGEGHGADTIAASAHHHETHEDSGPSHHQGNASHAHGDDPADSAAHTSHWSLCASSCSMTPMLSTMPALQEPGAAAAVHFPALSAPAPTFLSDGQERPPRSI